MPIGQVAQRQHDGDEVLILVSLPTAVCLQAEAAAINALAEQGIPAGERYAHLYKVYAQKRNE